MEKGKGALKKYSKKIFQNSKPESPFPFENNGSSNENPVAGNDNENSYQSVMIQQDNDNVTLGCSNSPNLINSMSVIKRTRRKGAIGRRYKIRRSDKDVIVDSINDNFIMTNDPSKRVESFAKLNDSKIYDGANKVTNSSEASAISKKIRNIHRYFEYSSDSDESVNDNPQKEQRQKENNTCSFIQIVPIPPGAPIEDIIGAVSQDERSNEANERYSVGAAELGAVQEKENDNIPLFIPIQYGAPIENIIGIASQPHIPTPNPADNGKTSTTGLNEATVGICNDNDSNVVAKPKRTRRKGFLGRIKKRKRTSTNLNNSDTVVEAVPPMGVELPVSIFVHSVAHTNEISQPLLFPEIEENNAQVAENVNVRLQNFIYPVAWCAMDDLSNDIVSHCCGQFDLICVHCNAIYFREELSTRGKYTHCCHDGKVSLPPLGPYPQLLLDLMEGRHAESQNFLRFIRKYNSLMSFTSVMVETDTPPGRGPYVFRIHGRMYHKISNSINPRGSVCPKYSQLYIYDAEEALRERQNIDTSNDLRENVLRDLDVLIRRINPFALSYRLMKDVEQEVLQNDGPDAIKDIRMWFTNARPSSNIHQGRQNAPITTDVAMIFRSSTGVPPPAGSFCIYSFGSGIREIYREHPSCDPLTYTIFFPNGERGWSGEDRCTLLQFYSYRFSVRSNNLNVILLGRRLTQQYIVDAYCAVESNRLGYIATHQKELRVDSYKGLMDHVSNLANNSNMRAGIPKILPSTFIGSPRNMQQRFQDAMAIVREFGKPDLFITFTCNPKWPEIKNNLFPGQRACDRPDIVSRVFDIKKKALIDDIVRNEIFGKVVAYIYVIEFQKRGLPHMHLLLILDSQYKIREAEDIDRVVSAEIPDKNTNRKLYKSVRSHMIHGPCGVMNRNSPCMVDGKCSKKYPKSFLEGTRANENGYPSYRRRDNGRRIRKRRNVIDNRHIVPYNPYLLCKYDAHINVEICSSLKSVKYIYKYVYKGHDTASITFCDNASNTLQWDEIRAFENSRYISAPEAMWRLLEKPLNEKSHTIIRLAVHLPDMQSVYFQNNNEAEALNRASRLQTHLTAFFKLNELDANAREHLYAEIPNHYVWDSKNSKWNPRRRGHNKIISRMYSVSIHDIEKYYLRMLLCHVRGPKSFEELRTYNGILYDSFKDACIARNLLEDDREWFNAIREACIFEMPRKLRQLFGYICVFCLPMSPLALWEEFKFNLSEDFIRISNNDAAGYERALADISKILVLHNQSLESMGLPAVNQALIDNSDVFDPIEEDQQYRESYGKLNIEQKKFFDDVLSELNGITSNGKYFHLNAFAGAGKSFVLNCILCKVRADGGVAIAVAWSGIAAMLLKGGTTVHSRFKLPISLDETSVCKISPNSNAGLYIKSAKIIVWDECTMTHKYGLEAVDRALRDVTGVNRPFGDKVVIISGDWRQILPVVYHGNRISTVESCIKNSSLWTNFRQYSLRRNMRTDFAEINFSRWLLKLGNGELSNNVGLSTNIIEIPPENVVPYDHLIDEIFGESIDDIPEDELVNRAILSTKNDSVLELNEIILTRLSGELRTYYSADSIMCEDNEDEDLYQIDFIHAQTPAGMPPHRLNLKVGAVVMLLRNLNITGGLCNGTRLIVRRLMDNVIDAEIAVGSNKGERVFIPRINLIPSDNNLPFQLKRRQFPLRLAFGMTINKAQGQSLRKVGILLREPVFTHGMLYVAFSRATNKQSVRVSVIDSARHVYIFAGLAKWKWKHHLLFKQKQYGILMSFLLIVHIPR